MKTESHGLVDCCLHGKSACKLSTGKEIILRICASFGRARGYPNGLGTISFAHEIGGGDMNLRGPVSREDWPEFLDCFERTLSDLSERLGVAFTAGRDYQRDLGTVCRGVSSAHPADKTHYDL